MRRFEEGKWRMRIRDDGEGEYMTDSNVPDAWRDCYTYHAKFEVK